MRAMRKSEPIRATATDSQHNRDTLRSFYEERQQQASKRGVAKRVRVMDALD